MAAEAKLTVNSGDSAEITQLPGAQPSAPGTAEPAQQGAQPATAEPAQQAPQLAPAEPAQQAPQPVTGQPAAANSAGAPSQPAPRTYNLAEAADVTELLNSGNPALLKSEIAKHLSAILVKHGLTEYATLLLYDNSDAISTFHSNQVYDAASALDTSKGIFLILQTPGGSIEPAYLISKTCSRLTTEKFIVAVPRKSKSAGTLLALGADEIHMGLMSELGPIDPQIDGLPALGLVESLKVVAGITCEHKESAELFARYLSRKLELENLGYYARLPESAAQYAERLLNRTQAKLPKGSTPQSVAKRLVHHYKDHRFVIDIDEAKEILGGLVKTGTPEYKAANEIYSFLTLLEFRLRLRGLDMWYVGTVEAGFATRKQAK